MTRRSTLIPALLPAALLLVPGAALAHPGHGEAAGFAGGLLHPLSGADHVLAMVAVGLLAAAHSRRHGGRALWALPVAFLAMMALGAGLGAAGVALPFVETGIALSVVAFGLAAGFGLGLPVAALAALVGAFAVLHGLAHGAEMPAASGLTYGLGFLAATAGLHAAGLAIGLAAAGSSTRVRARAVPVLGGLVAAAGLALLALP